MTTLRTVFVITVVQRAISEGASIVLAGMAMIGMIGFARRCKQTVRLDRSLKSDR